VGYQNDASLASTMECGLNLISGEVIHKAFQSLVKPSSNAGERYGKSCLKTPSMPGRSDAQTARRRRGHMLTPFSAALDKMPGTAGVLKLERLQAPESPASARTVRPRTG
jgi:hypothetical protein